MAKKGMRPVEPQTNQTGEVAHAPAKIIDTSTSPPKVLPKRPGS